MMPTASPHTSGALPLPATPLTRTTPNLLIPTVTYNVGMALLLLAVREPRLNRTEQLRVLVDYDLDSSELLNIFGRPQPVISPVVVTVTHAGRGITLLGHDVLHASTAPEVPRLHVPLNQLAYLRWNTPDQDFTHVLSAEIKIGTWTQHVWLAGLRGKAEIEARLREVLLDYLMLPLTPEEVSAQATLTWTQGLALNLSHEAAQITLRVCAR